MEDLVVRIRSYEFMEPHINHREQELNRQILQQSNTLIRSYNNLLHQSHQLIEHFSQYIMSIRQENEIEVEMAIQQKERVFEENTELKKMIEQLENSISQMREQLIVNDQQIQKWKQIAEMNEKNIREKLEESNRKEEDMIVLIKNGIKKNEMEKQNHFERMKREYEETLTKYEEQIEIQQRQVQNYAIENQMLANRINEMMDYIRQFENESFQLGECSPKMLKSFCQKDSSGSRSRSQNQSGLKNLSYENSFEGEGEVLQEILNTEGRNSNNYGIICSKERLMRIYQDQQNNLNSMNIIGSIGSQDRKILKEGWHSQEIQEFKAQQIFHNKSPRASKNEVDTNQQQINPYYCFYLITVQNEKIQSKNLEKASLFDMQAEWQYLNNKPVPLHEWSHHIRQQIKQLVRKH